MEQTQPFLHDILSALEVIAPFSLAESWDNVGLLVGDPGRKASGILVALDPTEEALHEAVACGCNTLVTHHPLIFEPLKEIRTDAPIGSLLAMALKNRVSVIGCHTNLDIATGGVNDILADKLGLQKTTPLTHTTASSGSKESSVPSNLGLGRIGHLAPPVPGREFLDRLLTALTLPAVQLTGTLPESVATAAVCGGSGSDLAAAAFTMGAQIYITSEVKHNIARWAEACGFCIVDAGHFPTENVVTEPLAAALRKHLAAEGFSVPVVTSRRQKNPFSLYNGQETTEFAWDEENRTL